MKMSSATTHVTRLIGLDVCVNLCLSLCLFVQEKENDNNKIYTDAIIINRHVAPCCIIRLPTYESIVRLPDT